MKKNYVQSLSFILLACISLWLFQSCERDDTSYPLQLEQKEIKTVSPKNASAYLNGFRESKSKHSGNYIVGIADTVLMEDISNTSEKLAVIPAMTVHRNLKSRILLLEIDGKVESVVFSTHAYDSSTAELFSGEILITDLEGNFIDAFEIISGKINVQYLKSKADSTKALQSKGIVDDENDDCGDGCPFSVCSWCGELEEVVITSTPSSDNYTLSIDWLYSQGSNGTTDAACEVGCDNYWSFGDNNEGGGGFNCYIPGDLNGDCVVNDEDKYFWPYADCSSWEYAIQNGVRAAAVKGVKDAWATDLGHGNIKLTGAYFGITLYFTMPRYGFTNGRAATETAKVVTEVGLEMGKWLTQPANHGVSDLQVEIKYYEMLQTGMKKIGGTVSKNDLYNLAIENPTQYKVNLLTETNCD